MKLLGFITGLGLVGAAIYTVSIGSGLHRFSLDSPSGKETLVEQLMDRAKQVSARIQSTDLTSVTPPVPPTELQNRTLDSAPSEQAPTPVTPSHRLPPPQEIKSAAPEPTEELPKDSKPTWYPLWSPFHSELSAQGFAKRLAALSGRSLRVTEEGPSRYRVQLAYLDSDDLKAALLAIRQTAGLDLAEEEM